MLNYEVSQSFIVNELLIRIYNSNITANTRTHRKARANSYPSVRYVYSFPYLYRTAFQIAL